MPDTNSASSTAPSGNDASAVQGFQAGVASDAGLSSIPPLGGTISGAADTAPKITPRIAERKLVTGRAQITIGSGFSVAGKMIDLSEGGTCVMLDDPVTIKKVCNISCKIYHNGVNHTFSLPAVVAYCVLVSGRGYKVGFQFGPRSPAVAKSIAEVMK